MAKSNLPCVLTASRTDDGAPVYRTPSGAWHRALEQARVFEDQAAADEALAAAAGEERLVCDPYLMKVTLADAGRAEPVSARERIRATGPTSRLRRPDPVVTP